MAPLSDCVIAVAGTFPISHGKIETTVKSLGGKFNTNVKGITHLITLPNNASAKFREASANDAIKIVTLDWLDACEAQKKLVDESSYAAAKADAAEEAAEPKKRGRAATKAEPVAEADEEKPPAKKARAARGKAAKTEEDVDMKDAEEEEKPKANGKRGKKDVVVDDAAPAPAATNGRAKRGAAKAAPADDDVEMKDEEEEEKPKRAARGKKAAAASQAKDDEEEEEEPKRAARGKKATAASQAKDNEDDKDAKADAAPAVKGKGKDKKTKDDDPPAPSKIKTITAQKGCAPVDEYVPNRDSYKVYIDEHGVSYDGSLNQTNIGSNANKFYYVQLLETANGAYATWTRWGRVGEKGQMKMVAGPMSNLHSCMYEFENKFKAKSGLPWEQRHSAPRSGKYTYVEKSYEESDDEEDPTSAVSKKSEEEEFKIPESKIHKALQDLMSLIFNVGFFNASMESMNYDANKLPLGKLSKATIKKGYEVLKKMGDIIQSPTATPAERQQLIDLSNQYYSIIPHVSGRQAPPVINDAGRLKRESDLIDSLGEMQIANEIMKTNSQQKYDINPLDAQFNSLKLNTAEPLDHSTQEYKLLEAYMLKTHGSTHNFGLQVEEIFRVHRQEEEDRWTASGWDKHPLSHRMLLWHGSRTTNFGGILSQGLRIAPPEAPVNGYMFGKGVYLADMASKSAQYCCASSSNNTGLLLLCEAQVGNPMYELIGSSYNAGDECKADGKLATKGCGRSAPLKWMDAAPLGEWAKGAVMPDVNDKNVVGDVKLQSGYLQYNEYIVYDISQVKIRYLFRCKF